MRPLGPASSRSAVALGVPEASRAFGGLSAFCLLFSRSSWCLAAAARFWPPPALDSQFPCLCRQNASPQGGDLSTPQCFCFLRHAFGGCLEGPESVSGLGVWQKLVQGQSSTPRLNKALPQSPTHVLFGLVLSRFIKDIQRHAGPQTDALGGFADGSACQDQRWQSKDARVPVSSLTLHHQGSRRKQGSGAKACPVLPSRGGVDCP